MGLIQSVGRKPLAPTDKDRELVKKMSAVGIRFADIAACVMGGVDEKTLKKYFDEELTEGRVQANMAVGKTLYEKAVKDKDTAALIWWSKTRMRWAAAKDPDVGEENNGHGHTTINQIERVIVNSTSDAENSNP